jgi:diaminopimelate decarboxylase
VADGREDALAVLSRARALGLEPRYLLRLAPSSVSQEQRRFGLEASKLLGLAREISRRRAPPPEGLAFHLGTGIASAAPYLRALREAGEVRAALAPLGIPVRTLDLGGGFAAETESRLDDRGRPLAAGGIPSDRLAGLAREARRRAGPGLRLLFEPGRGLVSGSVHLVCRVVRVKRTRPRATVYLDASRLSHAFFVARGRHPIAAIPRRRGTPRPLALAGPLGVGFDLFAPSATLSPPAPGDLVVIGSVGAYNQIAASAWAGPVPLLKCIM